LTSQNLEQLAKSGDHFQNLLLAAQIDFAKLAVFDIGVNAAPFHKLFIVVMYRFPTKQKSTIFAIRTAESTVASPGFPDAGWL
jgi:hypothetical protein